MGVLNLYFRFLGKWRSVCLGLTKKILSDSYKLPFFKIKFPKDFENNRRSKINEIYADINRSASLLCISYDRIRVGDRSDSVTSVSAIYCKKNIYKIEFYICFILLSIAAPEIDNIFWAKLDYEQVIYFRFQYLRIFFFFE
jgi:hypothetical protein